VLLNLPELILNFKSLRCLNARTINSIKLEIENAPFDLIDLVSGSEDKRFIFKKLFMEIVDSVTPVKNFKLK
jgi:hypothetical protein